MGLTAIIYGCEPYEQPVEVCCVDLTHLPSVINAGLTTLQMQELMDNAKHLFAKADFTPENLQRAIVQFYIDGLPMRKQVWSTLAEGPPPEVPVRFGRSQLWDYLNDEHTLPRVAICMQRPARAL